MRITIEAIDTSAEERLGNMRVPSFPVRFHSAVVAGQARFVPASGKVQLCAGQSFFVEIDQEVVSEFKVVKPGKHEGVVALSEPGDFQVCGVVSSIVLLTEPEVDQIISIAAGEAFFTLTLADLGGAKPSKGDLAEFVVHRVSLFDEAI